MKRRRAIKAKPSLLLESAFLVVMLATAGWNLNALGVDVAPGTACRRRQGVTTADGSLSRRTARNCQRRKAP